MKIKEIRALLEVLAVIAALGLGVCLVLEATPPVKAASGGISQSGPSSCCIAGSYKGKRTDTASATCPEPTTEEFSMEISQAAGCGAGIWGTVVGASDPTHIQKFTGSVSRAPRRACCNISGKTGEPAEVTEFQGTLCRKAGKWSGSGTYKTTREGAVCSGTWTMSQI